MDMLVEPEWRTGEDPPDHSPGVVAQTEEDENECRICRGTEEEDRRLFFPCKCSGSIRYIHEDCLVRWLSQSRSNRCELCGHEFKFEPVYRSDAPSVLSATEFALGILARLRKTAYSLVRVATAGFVWLLCLPLGTCWTWRTFFLRRVGDLPNVFRDWSIQSLCADVLYGAALSALVVIIFFGVSSLRDHLSLDHLEEGLNPVSYEEEETEHQTDGDTIDEDPLLIVDQTQEPEGNIRLEHNRDGGAFLGLFEFDVEEVPLEEVIGLEGPVRNLFDNAGTFLISNAFVLSLLVFLPLLLGRMTLKLTLLQTHIGLLDQQNWLNSLNLRSNDAYSIIDRCESSELCTVGLGYSVLGLCSILFVSLSHSLRRRYPIFNSTAARQTLLLLQYMGMFIKVVVLIILEFGLFPLGCGWWLDICLLDFVGVDLASRRQFLHQNPWASFMAHWVLGIFFMVGVALFVSLLREVLRPSLLSFLRNPDDPDFHPFKELVEKPLVSHARRILFAVTIYIPAIVVMIYFPTQLCLVLFPSVFPYKLRFNDPLIIPADALLFHICVLFANSVRFVHPRTLFKSLVIAWIRTVSKLLGLQGMVLREDLVAEREEQGGSQGGDLGEATSALHETDPARTVSRSVYFRASVMLILAWITSTSLGCGLISLPTIWGRWLFRFLGIGISHDIYNSGLGLYAIWAVLELTMHLHHYLVENDMLSAVVLWSKWLVFGAKCLLLWSLWFGAIPLAFGILLEFTFLVPARVRPEESAYLPIYRDWALGLAFVRLWVRLVLHGFFNDGWREKLERIGIDRFGQMGENFSEALLEVILPLLARILLPLSLPFVVSFGWLPSLGYGTFECMKIFRASGFYLFCMY